MRPAPRPAAFAYCRSVRASSAPGPLSAKTAAAAEARATDWQRVVASQRPARKAGTAYADGRVSPEQTFNGPHEPLPRRGVPRAGNGNDCGSDLAVIPIGRVSAI